MLAKQALEASPNEAELQEAEVAASVHLDDVERKHKALQMEAIAAEHHAADVAQTLSKLKDEMLEANYKGPSKDDLDRLNMKLTIARVERAEALAAEKLIGDGILKEQVDAVLGARRGAKAGNEAAGAGFTKSSI